jgi:hypothetical protein
VSRRGKGAVNRVCRNGGRVSGLMSRMSPGSWHSGRSLLRMSSRLGRVVQWLIRLYQKQLWRRHQLKQTSSWELGNDGLQNPVMAMAMAMQRRQWRRPTVQLRLMPQRRARTATRRRGPKQNPQRSNPLLALLLYRLQRRRLHPRHHLRSKHLHPKRLPRLAIAT